MEQARQVQPQQPQQQYDFDWGAYEQRMVERFWTYLYQAAAICGIANAIILGTILKYSSHPNPPLACIQILLPLLMWELLLVFSFCPTDVVEFYLAEMLVNENLHELDRALMHLFPGHRIRFLQMVHSAGDVSTRESPPNSQTNLRTEHTVTDVLLTERQIPTPYHLTE